ncbi:MAG: hypothetical protein QM769_02480 [Pseudoxanthomonas sp.]
MQPNASNQPKRRCTSQNKIERISALAGVSKAKPNIVIARPTSGIGARFAHLNLCVPRETNFVAASRWIEAGSYDFVGLAIDLNTAAGLVFTIRKLRISREDIFSLAIEACRSH